MKILIVSGFLGAGKTTFIKELIRRTDKRIVILENEYGSADVDRQVIQSEEKADVWDLNEGCVCCTKSSDMNASVMTIESTLEPEFLIIEPSGIGALSNVIRSLRKIEYERIVLLRPLAVVDAGHFARDVREFSDVYRDQINSAGTVVISKPDHPDAELRLQVESAIHEINPDTTVLDRHYTGMPQEWWDSLLTTAYDGKDLNETDEPVLNLETYTVRDCSVISPAALLWILEGAVFGRFGEIIRAKGILPAGRDWVRFDVVNGVISVEGCGDNYEKEGAEAECVWIGRAVDIIGIRRFLTDWDIKPGNIISDKKRKGSRHPQVRPLRYDS